MKFIIKLLGLGFLIGGLIYFAKLFNVGGYTTNIYTLLLRLLNSIIWILTGYGLVNLKRWSLYGLGAMIVFSVITAFYNLYFTNASISNLNLVVPSLHVILLLILYSNTNKILTK